MEINEEKLKQIKEKSKENHVPIILDETLEYITNEIKTKKINVQNILEIGTATGYSICSFMRFVDDSKPYRIDTIERDEMRFEIASDNINEMKLDINLHFGDATNILKEINNKYDLIFIDANKSKYPIFLDLCLPKLNDGGIIFADNILFKGYVLSDYNEHKHRTCVRHLREFINTITNSNKLDSKVIDIGDGLGVIRWRK